MRGWSAAAFAAVVSVAAPAAAGPQDPALVQRIQADVVAGQRAVADGRPEVAEPLLRRAAEEAHALWGPTSPDGAALTYLWADAVNAQPNRLAEAEALYRLSIERFEAWGDLRHPQAVLALTDLAANLHAQGRYAEAMTWHDRGLVQARDLYGEDSPIELTLLSNRAVTLRVLGRFEEADAAYRHVLAVRRATLPAADPLIATTLQNLAVNLLQMDRREEAEPALREAIAIREASLGTDHPLTAQSVSTLGGLLASMGRLPAALAMQERAIAILRPGRDDVDLATALGSLAAVRQSLGDFEGALDAQSRALEIQERVLGPAHPETADSLIGMGDILLALGRAAEAEALLRRAVAIHEAASGADNPGLAEPLYLLAAAIGERGAREEAIAVMRRAAAVTAVLPPTHIDRIGAEADLGAALAANRQPAEALPLLRRAGRSLIDKAGQRAGIDASARRQLDGYRMVYRLTVTAAWDASAR